MTTPERGSRISVAVLSTVGLVADHNEDAVGIDGFVLTTQATHSILLSVDATAAHTFVVADGMGGRAGGAVASAIVAQHVSAAAAGESAEDGEQLLVHSVRRARQVLDARAADDPSLEGFGTTAVALHWAPSGDVTVLQVGDSMAYRFVEEYLGAVGAPHRSTDPTTLGKLTDHLGARQLDRALPEATLLKARPGARFVLCTDGVWEAAANSDGTFEELERRLGIPDLEAAAEATLEFVFEHGATDNATAVIIEIPMAAGTGR